MRGDNDSVSHKSGRPDFWKNKSDHKKKYEAQENVDRGRKNEVHAEEKRNWRTNYKYLHRLRNGSRYCESEKLGQEEQTIEEDLIL